MSQAGNACSGNDDGWENKVSGGSAAPANLQLLFVGQKRIAFLRKMFYVNVALAVEITNKYYFDTFLGHQRFCF